MLQWKRRPRQTARSDGDALAELLAGEERVASQLDAARSEAEQILRDAQDYARLAELACASTIETRVAALATEHERELEDALRAIESRAAEDIARFDGVGEARANELAALVLRRVGALDAPDPAESAR